MDPTTNNSLSTITKLNYVWIILAWSPLINVLKKLTWMTFHLDTLWRASHRLGGCPWRIFCTTTLSNDWKYRKNSDNLSELAEIMRVLYQNSGAFLLFPLDILLIKFWICPNRSTMEKRQKNLNVLVQNQTHAFVTKGNFLNF